MKTPEFIRIPGYLDRIVTVEEISYFIGDGAYTNIHFLNGEKLCCSSNLAIFEEQGLKTLIRPHKQFMVVITSVEELIIQEGWTTENKLKSDLLLFMPDKTLIPVAKREEKTIVKLCKNYQVPFGMDLNTSAKMTKQRALNITAPYDWI